MHCKGDFSANKGVADRIAVQGRKRNLQQRFPERFIVQGMPNKSRRERFPRFSE